MVDQIYLCTVIIKKISIMKKLFVIGAIAVGTLASALPFRTTCGIVFQINDNYVKNATPKALENTMSQLNYNACGTFPTRFVYYTSSTS